MISAHRRAALELVREAVREAGTSSWSVTGSCMQPLVHDGDRVVVQSPFEAEVGHVVLATSERGELVCHRVLASRPELLLAGDHSHRVDAHAPDSLVGRVVAIRRNGVTLRLDRGAWQRWDATFAAWHLWVYRRLHGPSGRSTDLLVDYLRLAMLRLRSWAWLWPAGRG